MKRCAITKNDEDRMICAPGAKCRGCDEQRVWLAVVSPDQVTDLFSLGWTIYYEDENGRIRFRSWWNKTKDGWHQPPSSIRLWVQEKALAQTSEPLKF